jgi:hypothetical protein
LRAERGVDLDVAGIADAVEVERKVIVVLGRVDLDPVRQAIEHISEHRHRVVDGKLLRARRRLVDVGLVGLQPRRLVRGGGRYRGGEQGGWQAQSGSEHLAVLHGRTGGSIRAHAVLRSEWPLGNAFRLDFAGLKPVPGLFMAIGRSSYRL